MVWYLNGNMGMPQFYKEILNRLLRRIRRLRPQLSRTGQWVLLPDNVPDHSAICMGKFLVQHGITGLDHPPYSPALAPADFFLFSHMNEVLKGAHFEDMWHLFCDRFRKRHFLKVSRTFTNVAKSVLRTMLITLKANKGHLFVSSVLFLF